MAKVAIWCVCIYAAWCATLYVMQSRMLYVSGAAGPGRSEAEVKGIPGVEQLWIEHADGARTEAWLIRTSEKPPRGLVCFLHGNAELIDHALHEARAWNARGMDVVLPEYRGYGRTPGSPSQPAIVQDASDAIDAALAATGSTRLVLHGRSLGTGVAAQVAVLRGLAPAAIAATTGLPGGAGARAALVALVLESPFTSIAGYAWGYGVPPFIVTNPYRTDEVLPSIECPVLILHGRDDEIVPIAQGRALAALHPRATLVELDGSHNSGHSRKSEYWRAIDGTLAATRP